MGNLVENCFGCMFTDFTVDEPNENAIKDWLNLGIILAILKYGFAFIHSESRLPPNPDDIYFFNSLSMFHAGIIQ